MQFRHVFGQVFGLESSIAAAVFGLVLTAMAAAVIISWWRRRRGLPAFQRAENNRLELSYILVLAGMAVFLVITSFSSNAAFFRDPPPVLRVKVTAFQWCWRFQYTGEPVSVSGRCGGGKLPTLVLPAGRPVQVELSSQDVIHSFWVPGLRFKMYAYPGHVNSFTFTLHDGRWLGRCAEFCGLYHYGMMFYLQAVPPGQFSRWLRAQPHVAGPA